MSAEVASADASELVGTAMMDRRSRLYQRGAWRRSTVESRCADPAPTPRGPQLRARCCMLAHGHRPDEHTWPEVFRPVRPAHRQRRSWALTVAPSGKVAPESGPRVVEVERERRPPDQVVGDHDDGRRRWPAIG